MELLADLAATVFCLDDDAGRLGCNRFTVVEPRPGRAENDNKTKNAQKVPLPRGPFIIPVDDLLNAHTI